MNVQISNRKCQCVKNVHCNQSIGKKMQSGLNWIGRIVAEKLVHEFWLPCYSSPVLATHNLSLIRLYRRWMCKKNYAFFSCVFLIWILDPIRFTSHNHHLQRRKGIMRMIYGHILNCNFIIILLFFFRCKHSLGYSVNVCRYEFIRYMMIVCKR